MRSWKTITAVLLAVTALAAFVALLAPGGVRAGYYVTCHPFTGPKWNQAPHFGTRYQLQTHGAACTFATPWAKALTAKRSAGPGKPLAGGPRGYRCTTNNPRGFLASQGSCQKGAASFFSWAPKVA